MANAVRILIVDDEPGVRKVLEIVLHEKGWQTTSVASAEEAIEVLKRETFDLLLVDKNLPAMNGVELLRHVRQTHADVAAIMITGYGSTESAIEALHLGILAYIEKPFADVYEIAPKVEAALRRHARPIGDGLGAAKDHFKKVQAALGDAVREVRERGSTGLRIVVGVARDETRRYLDAKLAGDALTWVASADGLVRLAQSGAHDFAVVDTALGGGTWLNLVKRLREAAPQVPLAVIADKLSRDAVAELIELGVVALLEAPLDDRVFEERLGALLARARLGRKEPSRSLG